MLKHFLMDFLFIIGDDQPLKCSSIDQMIQTVFSYKLGPYNPYNAFVSKPKH